MEKRFYIPQALISAVLDGSKTMHRVALKPQPPEWVEEMGFTIFTPERHVSGRGFYKGNYSEKYFKLPYCKGDLLWVPEIWKYYEKAVGKGESFHVKKFLAYKADDHNDNIQKSSEWYEGKWRSPATMPMLVARIWLEVVGVRVERLQDIAEGDAKREGIKGYWAEPHEDEPLFVGMDLCRTRREAYKQIWNSHAKPGHGWDANDWVAVNEFRRVERYEQQ